MTGSVRVSGTWKDLASAHVKVGGVWKTVEQGYVKIAGVWKEFLAKLLGAVWVDTTAPLSAGWGGSASNGSSYILLGGTPTIRSTDKTTWSNVTIETTYNRYAITTLGSTYITPAYSNGSYSVTPNLIWTSPDGITWTQRTVPVAAGRIGAANNGSVAIFPGFYSNVNNGTASNSMAYTTDGITFNNTTIATSTWRQAIWKDSNFFVCGGSPSSSFLKSPTGTGSWTTGGLPNSNYWQDIAASPTTIVIVSDDSQYLTSTDDGSSWTSRTTPFGAVARSIAYGGKYFVMVTTGYSVYYYSEDGVTWTAGSWGSVRNVNYIKLAGDIMLAGNQNTTTVMVSK